MDINKNSLEKVEEEWIDLDISFEEKTAVGFIRRSDGVEDLPEYQKRDDEYKSNGETFDVTFIEFAMFNKYFYSLYREGGKDLSVLGYGNTDGIGLVNFGGVFDITRPWWFESRINDDSNEYIFQTRIYLDNRGDIITHLHITCKHGISSGEMEKLFKRLTKLAFNNSEYVGKCIKVKIKEGRFKGIEIIDIEAKTNELILTDTQKKYMDYFIERVKRGNSVRYLLNGEPGTGKTESIREAIRKLCEHKTTFIIPDFTTNEDLTIILEACEIFDKGVIIMDDVDLYIGSRANGSYTRLLGEFLSFFDGVKKRKVSLLASTNDKGLVDKAAERPGRFNMTLDYTFLTEEQIERVCNIHLPVEYQTKEVYKALNGNVGGKKAKITGAFIANLAENIREMSEGNDNWSIKDTLSLIHESYKGFYMSQIDKNETLGFKTT